MIVDNESVKKTQTVIQDIVDIFLNYEIKEHFSTDQFKRKIFGITLDDKLTYIP